MRKALYDQTLSRLARAPANGTAQLQLLGDELGLSGAAAQALGADGAAGRLPRVAGGCSVRRRARSRRP